MLDPGGDAGAAMPTFEGRDGPADVVSDVVARSPLELFWFRIRRDPVAMIAGGSIALLMVVALAAPLITNVVGAHPPNEQHPEVLNEYGDPLPPGGGYLLGTDGLGRDVFSRTLYGARVSLEVALPATFLIVVFGTFLGMLAGYYRGWSDTLLSRLFDLLLAFPVLLLALGLGAACTIGEGCLPMNYGAVGTAAVVAAATLGVVANVYWIAQDLRRTRSQHRGQRLILRNVPFVLILGLGVTLRYAIGGQGALIQPGFRVVLFIITLCMVPYLARIVRGQVLSIRETEYIEAQFALGASDARILFLHILPNLLAPIIVYATVLIPQTILFAAALSFLGVGIQPPTADWGAMIADATSVFTVAWWYMAAPGVALIITVLAFNLLGDAVQDALRPRHVAGVK